jgi:glutaredoxin
MEVTLFTKDNCSFCDKAKTLLRMNNIPFSEHKLGKEFSKEWLMETYPTASTFPVVVVDGFYIGGYSALTEAIVQNDSRSFLKE